VRFLANENFPLVAVEALRQQGHDILWIRIEAPGSRDVTVLEMAQAESRIVLTFDRDFGEECLSRRFACNHWYYSISSQNDLLRTG
jgi:predicted nuclease of predicted toxin-antitoxin system